MTQQLTNGHKPETLLNTTVRLESYKSYIQTQPRTKSGLQDAPQVDNGVVPVPQCEPEVEESLVAALMVDPTELDKVNDSLKVSDFHDQRCAAVYRAILKLADANEEINQITVAHILANTKSGLTKQSGEPESELEMLGGLSYLMRLTTELPTPAGCEYYAQEIVKAAQARAIIQACARLTGDVWQHWQQPGFVGKALAEFDNFIRFAVDERDRFAIASRIGDIVAENQKRLEERLTEPDILGGIPTGFGDLDVIIDGLKNFVYVLGGKPGGWKTQFAVHAAHHVAALDHTVVFFSMEMSKEELTERLIVAKAKLSMRKIRNMKHATDEEIQRLTLEMDHLIADDPPFYICDRSDITLNVMRKEIRTAERLNQDKPLGLVVIDYLHIMPPPDNVDKKRDVQLQELMRQVASIKTEFHCPVLVLAQLSRDGVKGDTLDQTAFYQGAGIEQRGDVTMILAPSKLKDEKDSVVVLHIFKNKSGGGPGVVPIQIIPATGEMHSFTPRKDDE
jgi:replicative DNA helicase